MVQAISSDRSPELLAAIARVHTEEFIRQWQPMIEGTIVPRIVPFIQFARGFCAKQEKDRTYGVSDQQRDQEQWSRDLQCLFVDSVLGGVPTGLVLAHEERDSVTRRLRTMLDDGQQRLTTLVGFMNNEWPLLPAAQVDYDKSVVPFAGMFFRDLPEFFKNRIRDYSLVFVVFPEGTPEGVLLEVFKRHNRGGSKLSAQDIRAAAYYRSTRGQYIRASGLYQVHLSSGEYTRNAARVLRVAARFGGRSVWTAEQLAVWNAYWGDSVRGLGQQAAEDLTTAMLVRVMQQHTLVNKDEDRLVYALLNASHLQARTTDATSTLMDRFFEQIQREETDREVPWLIPGTAVWHRWMQEIARWFTAIISEGKVRKFGKFSPNSSTRLFRTLGALAAVLSGPENLNDEQWKLVFVLLKSGAPEIRKQLRGVKVSKQLEKLKAEIDKLKWPKGKINDFVEHVRVLYLAVELIAAAGDPSSRRTAEDIAKDFTFQGRKRPEHAKPFDFKGKEVAFDVSEGDESDESTEEVPSSRQLALPMPAANDATLDSDGEATAGDGDATAGDGDAMSLETMTQEYILTVLKSGGKRGTHPATLKRDTMNKVPGLQEGLYNEAIMTLVGRNKISDRDGRFVLGAADEDVDASTSRGNGKKKGK